MEYGPDIAECHLQCNVCDGLCDMVSFKNPLMFKPCSELQTAIVLMPPMSFFFIILFTVVKCSALGLIFPDH